ncbi:MAG: hypothetical protein C4527_23055 [Candidatus Omnitrophota bacterium]|jgi:ABC-type transport system involved in multi-copper enzyme maturation permease subunit|nr:MAG: hypothetical protein C4527_23055 [Candidatus Omnitrophota bacterium]
MNRNSFAIFRKDVKLLSGQAIAALAVQAALMILVPVLISLLQLMNGNQPASVTPYKWWFPQMQIAISVIIAFIAAAYWSAEERDGGHDRFLQRLPVSRMRIRREKTAAGLCIVLAVSLIQLAWYWIFYLWGVSLWDAGDPVFTYLFALSIIAYFVGLSLSSVLPNAIAVIIIGVAILFLGSWAFQLWNKQSLKLFWQIIMVVATVGLTTAVAL